MIRIFAAGLATLVLAACDASPTGTTAPVPVATPDAMEAKIDALPPALQQVTMFRAIRDGGYTCQKIMRFEKRPPQDGKPTWVAECDDRGQYVIELHDGGIFWVSGVPQPKKRFQAQ